MSSSEKTSILGLNKWALSDKPKCDDFNRDNQNLERIVGGHTINNTIHVTTADKALWNTPFVIGSFFGNNKATLDYNIGFQPKCVIVFADSIPSIQLKNGVYHYYAAFALSNAPGYGVCVTSSGFRVTQAQSADSYGCMARLNEAQLVYKYIAFK